MDAVILIPARLNSSRFPGKPLARIHGETMIARAVRIAQQSSLATEVHVLTDAREIVDAVPRGIGVLSTDFYHNGTERCAAYARRRYGQETRVAILQGDDVTITGRDIDFALACSEEHYVTTLVSLVPPKRRPTKDDVFARLTAGGVVVEFKRRDSKLGWHHVGVYIATTRMLKLYADSPQCSPELHEKLEQHRWESIGVPMRAVKITTHTESVNRPEDIAAVEELLCLNASTLVGGPASK